MGNKPIHSSIPFFINYCLDPSGKMPKFYLTTPLYYVNDKPHIGHAYTTLACDVMARFKERDGYQVHFLTGTDEHGDKIEEAAAAGNAQPRQYADRVAGIFRDTWDECGIS